MIIWITGCAGFLGSRLARTLAASGHQIVGLSRRPSAYVTESIVMDLAADSAPEQLAEISDRRGRPDVVVHAASRQPGSQNLSDYVKSNVLATSNLLEGMKMAPPRLVIYTSSQSVYGQPATVPARETEATNSTTPYGLSKRWAEQLCEGFSNCAQVLNLRLPSLYGAGQGDSFIDGLARLALNNEPIELFSRGAFARDALHVETVVKAIQAGIDEPSAARFRCLNLGCGERITSRDYAEELITALGSSSKVIPVDRPAAQAFDLYADIEAARREIHFDPPSLKASLNIYVDELRA
jgi:UDP-glucuronate 4-epimerase